MPTYIILSNLALHQANASLCHASNPLMLLLLYYPYPCKPTLSSTWLSLMQLIMTVWVTLPSSAVTVSVLSDADCNRSSWPCKGFCASGFPVDRRLEVNLVLGLPRSLQFCLVMNELRPRQTHTYIKLSLFFSFLFRPCSMDSLTLSRLMWTNTSTTR